MKGYVLGLGIAVTVGAAFVACGGDVGSFGGGSSTSTTTGAMVCIPGAQVECACPGGGKGAQVCSDDGSALGACTCGAGGSGGTTSTSTSSTTGTTSSSSTTSSSTSTSSSSTTGSGAGGSGGGDLDGGPDVEAPYDSGTYICVPTTAIDPALCAGWATYSCGYGYAPDAGETKQMLIGNGCLPGLAPDVMCCPPPPPDSGSCTGHVYYAGRFNGAGAVWGALTQAMGATGLDAGDNVCKSLGVGADHVCDYEEVLLAQMHGELTTIPAGTTAWVHRTTTAMVGGFPSAPGPGGRCNDWKYNTNHISDGEYVTFAANGVPSFFLDNDTVFDPAQPGVHTQADLPCGGAVRSILCCYPACP